MDLSNIGHSTIPVRMGLFKPMWWIESKWDWTTWNPFASLCNSILSVCLWNHLLAWENLLARSFVKPLLFLLFSYSLPLGSLSLDLSATRKGAVLGLVATRATTSLSFPFFDLKSNFCLIWRFPKDGEGRSLASSPIADSWWLWGIEKKWKWRGIREMLSPGVNDHGIGEGRSLGCISY